MLRKLWLDVVLGSLFIIGLVGLFASVVQFKIFEVFDPIGDALGEMEFTDLVMSQLRDTPVADDRIVLVNMSTLSRPEIGMMLNIIEAHNPAVIGIDSFFDFPKEDTLGDLMLAEALANIENLVMVTQLIANDETDEVDSMRQSWPELFNYGEKAYANLPTEAKDQDDLKMCRSMWPTMTELGETHLAFPVKLASYLDSAAVQEFVGRGVEEELINFTGNIIDYGATRFGNAYFALDWFDVFDGNFVPDMIDGKIVMFCYLGEFMGDRRSVEDKFITPLNAYYVGRALPDMYGGVIHANAVSMILSRNYISYMTEIQAYITAVILLLINVFFFTIIYKKIPKWYDGVTKLLQLLQALSLVFLQILIFNEYNFAMDLGPSIILILLAGDALEVYHGVIKNALTKEGRRSLFKADKI